jgi:hypothetical protein
MFFAGVLPDCERYDKMCIEQSTDKFLSEMAEG